jgi:hypothetical protein
MTGELPYREDLAGALLALATTEARTPEGRARLTASLQITLRALGAGGVCVCAGAAFATAGVADALGEAAAGLALAAEGLTHVATHARVILPPP